MQTRASERSRPAGYLSRAFSGAATILFWGAATLVADPPGPAQIELDPAMTEPAVSLGVEVTLIAVSHGGTGPFTYLWRRNGQEIAGADAVGPRLNLGAVELADAGAYTVLVGNAEGEALSVPLSLAVDARFRSIESRKLGNAFFSAWGDLNGDHWPDLVAARSGRAVVFLNARDGPLQVQEALTTGSDHSNFLTLADFDNDGLLDLVITELNNRTLRIFRNAGGGHFVRQRVEGLGERFAGATAVDLNQDGYLDLIVPAHEEARGRVYINEAGTGFRRWNAGDPGKEWVGQNWTFYVAWGDYDADGRMDAFVSGAAGAYWLKRCLSDGNFETVPEMSGPNTWPYGRAEAAWADYDNDGDLDLVVGAFADGVTWLFRNGSGVLSLMTAEEVGSVVTDPANTAGVTWGDYDNDGDLDLYVARSRFLSVEGTYFNSLHENQGDGTFRRAGLGSLTASVEETWVAQWVDYDLDGLLDLSVATAEDERLPQQHTSNLFHNELRSPGNPQGWLQVRCEGRVTNRDGIGAMVRLKARIGGAERWLMRSIASSASGQPLVAHFGLGDAPRVEVLRIEWPSGIVQEYRDVPVNQFRTVKEPPRLVPTGPCEFVVQCWPGMRFTVEASPDLETWVPVGTVMHVNGTARFSDAVGVHGTCRFYRVVDD